MAQRYGKLPTDLLSQQERTSLSAYERWCWNEAAMIAGLQAEQRAYARMRAQMDADTDDPAVAPSPHADTQPRTQSAYKPAQTGTASVYSTDQGLVITGSVPFIGGGRRKRTQASTVEFDHKGRARYGN